MTAGTNWAGNHTYRARRLHRPTTLEQVQEIVAAAPRIRVLGSRHSFTGIADSAELLSLEAVSAAASPLAGIDVDLDGGTVTLGGGVRYGELAEVLRDAGAALHNTASLPHISVAGAVATATHGSGVTNGNLATAVAALEVVTSDGEVVRMARGDADFDGMVVGLGALGAVTRLTLDVEPAFEVAQRVFEGLSWDALSEHFDEVVGCGYSVSLFTLWGEDVEMIWVKSRTDRDGAPDGDLFGAVPAVVDRNPVVGLDPTPCTPQLGRPGPWSDRLPHFRMGFTPSVGDELQSEYLLHSSRAVEAITAVRAIAARIRPLLLTCEIRTVAADRLWLSTAYGHDCVALHFTWRRDPAGVLDVLTDLEAALDPFGARPHWGKVFRSGATRIAPLYERHADFVDLVQRLDPRGAFRNDWLEERVLGR
ncbi:FAD-binding protein [Geodermatophilus sabuli]|uniref:Xylitol oxidase n=1 Tax=Geodermatophilus sabuli TaxID=1564158 RepID=A0A285EHU0_9ACTN|nr:FAD-binding protein [Geodermatophilus sabuli]MBB3083919.1 xylitol oxidase [Geodermatophilus sabuli]SNX98567.1 xylitol oxidase [Geodermatophilus sabuli]